MQNKKGRYAIVAETHKKLLDCEIFATCDSHQKSSSKRLQSRNCRRSVTRRRPGNVNNIMLRGSDLSLRGESAWLTS
jgi:hypothetical protein